MPDLIAPVPTGVGISVISTEADHHTRALGNWQSDNADDFRAPPGTPVLAVEAGTVTKVNLRHEGEHGGNIFGAQVTIRGASGGAFYTHVERVTLKQGQTVRQGQVIGYVTRWDDHPTDSHVHVGMERAGLADSLAHAQQASSPESAVAASSVPLPASPSTQLPTSPPADVPASAPGPADSLGGGAPPGPGQLLTPTPTLPAAELPNQPPGAGSPTLGLPGSVDLAPNPHEVADSWQLVSAVLGDPDAQRWAQNALFGSGR